MSYAVSSNTDTLYNTNFVGEFLFIADRICVTEKSNNKKYTKYCPILEKSGSKATCVLGHSR